MQTKISGCGRKDMNLTLYRAPDPSVPEPLIDYVHGFSCGFTPPASRVNAILLCDECIARAGYPAMEPSSVSPEDLLPKAAAASGSA